MNDFIVLKLKLCIFKIHVRYLEDKNPKLIYVAHGINLIIIILITWIILY